MCNKLPYVSKSGSFTFLQFYFLSVCRLLSSLIYWHRETKMPPSIRSKTHWEIYNFTEFGTWLLFTTCGVCHIHSSTRSEWARGTQRMTDMHVLKMINVDPTSLHFALLQLIKIIVFTWKTYRLILWHQDTLLWCCKIFTSPKYIYLIVSVSL